MPRSAADIQPVLFVVTSVNVKGDTGIPSGFNLAEVTHPLDKLQAAGIAVEFASPQGGAAPPDGMEDFNDEVDPSRYAAIFFAGGHGTMWDFPDNEAAHCAIREIDAAGGIVSAVCHGPAALVNARRADGSLLVAGKRLAAFTDGEEEEVQSTHVVPFLLASTLVARGALHQNAPNWSDKVVVDGRLITGQNPQSAAHLGEVLRDALLELA